MQDSLDNYLRMTALVIQFFTDNAQVTTDAPVIGEIVDKVKSGKDAINGILEKRGGRSSGLAGSKRDLQLKLAGNANRVLQALHSIAAGGSIPDLFESTKLSMWKLLKLRDKALADKCREVHETAQAYADKLASYGIKPEVLDSLLTDSDEYENMITAVGAAMKNKAGLTDSLEEAEDSLKHIIDDELDPAMEAVLSTDNKDLFNQYKKVRQVIDYGVRHETGTDTQAQAAT